MQELPSGGGMNDISTCYYHRRRGGRKVYGKYCPAIGGGECRVVAEPGMRVEYPYVPVFAPQTDILTPPVGVDIPYQVDVCKAFFRSNHLVYVIKRLHTGTESDVTTRPCQGCGK